MVHGTRNQAISPLDVKAGNQRKHALNRTNAIKCIPNVERSIDTFDLALQQRHDQQGDDATTRTPWTKATASQAASVLLRCFKSFVFVLPELHCFELLSKFKLTTYRPVGALQFSAPGVRMCCPVCQSNKCITYDRVRGLPLHGFGSKRLVLDWQCSCGSPNCPAVKSNVLEKNKLTNSETVDINNKTQVKNNNCRHVFGTSDLRLLKGILPPEVGFMLDVFNRGRSSLTGELRRALVTFDDDATLHNRLKIKNVHRSQNRYKSTKYFNFFSFDTVLSFVIYEEINSILYLHAGNIHDETIVSFFSLFFLLKLNPPIFVLRTKLDPFTIFPYWRMQSCVRS